MFVYDYVIYNGEPIIEFRLKYLNDYVDRFIIVESIYTHSGNKKEDFYFNMRCNRRKRRWRLVQGFGIGWHWKQRGSSQGHTHKNKSILAGHCTVSRTR